MRQTEDRNRYRDRDHYRDSGRYRDRDYSRDGYRERREHRASENAYARIMGGTDPQDEDYDSEGYDAEDDDVRNYGNGTGGFRNTERGAAGRRGRRSHARRGRKKKPFRIIALLLGVLLLFFGWMTAKSLLQGENWTIAVFGVDSREGELEKHTRSDVIMLVNVNQKTGDIKLASVYRDTYLRVNDDSEYNKINKAFEEGGHAQAVKALEENLNLKIDDYMTFSWAAVAKGINALGGVDLEISDAEFSIINGFITETVNSTGIGSVQLTHPGMQHLDGVQAVAYGRLRLIDTDFNRTARQRKVLSLAMDKAKQADGGTLVKLAAALLPEVSTSIGIDDMAPVLKNLNRYQIVGTKGFPFSLKTMDIGKLDVVVPTTLESNVVLLHQFLYDDAAYTAPQRVKDISARIGRDSGLTEPGKELADFGTDGGVVYHAPEPMTAAPETEAASEFGESGSESESALEESTSADAEGTDETGAEAGTEEGDLEENGDGLRPTETAEEDPAGGPEGDRDTEEGAPTEEAPEKETGTKQTASSEAKPTEAVTEPHRNEETAAGPGMEGENSPTEAGPGSGDADAEGSGTVISDAPGPGNA